MISLGVLSDNDPQSICTILEPYLTDRRKARIESIINKRLNSIRVALESPYDPHNAAAVVRNCEGFGLLHLDIISPESEAIKSRGVTQGSFHWLKIQTHDTLKDFLQTRQQDMVLAGANVEGQYELSELPIEKPLCIILGNEHHGLSETALKACDIHYRIPMFGMSESFNLSVSAGISLYDLTQRRRQHLKKDSDLTKQEIDTLRAEYYIQSTEDRLLKSLF